MKKRLDVLLFEKGFLESREKAKLSIMEGFVFVDNQKADKPGMLYDENCSIEVRQKALRFVSRGGLKLDKAIKVFGITLSEVTALDCGASTGGFTDCMLQNGCKKVYAVDVGYGQLDWKIRNDPRVINLERTNIRYITKNEIDDNIEFFSMDLSFISICTVLGAVKEVVNNDAKGVCLIKPQFEVGRDKVGKNGVVRDSESRIFAINKIVSFCLENGFSVLNLDFSPIRGPKGNIEYLLYVQKSQTPVLGKTVNPQEAERRSREKFSLN